MGDLEEEIRELESLKDEALFFQDAPKYAELCDQLGLDESDIANYPLYEAGRASLQSNFSKSKVEEVSEEIKPVDYNSILEILLPRFRVFSNQNIRDRLGKVSRLGYEVPSFGGLKGPRLKAFYASVKDEVYRKAKNTCKQTIARITRDNKAYDTERQEFR